MTAVADGLLIIDKPAGVTSHDVVAQLRRILKTRRVGHGGTLDPMATGILIIGVNAGTKALQFVSGADKTYTATIRLGIATTTDDAEGERVTQTDASGIADEQIRSALMTFVGEIQQVPSSVSAIKINGERAYARVRAGKDVELAARPITVHQIDVHDIRHEAGVIDVDLSVRCGTGTYIRAIARDLGTALNVGGHLTALRRTESCGFTLSDAVTVDTAADAVQPLADALARFMPSVTVQAEQEILVGRGQRLPWVWGNMASPVSVLSTTGEVMAIGHQVDELLGYHAVFAENLAG